ncbi:D-TA family PLP-dependent enzyme [Spongiimicrobium salis]|uniref:D-TA family PLP-dependent enzyme n=1 Tax=Spongiimicrobium salis TaxID=1667022 RepID=UPI00374DAB20
MDKATWYQLDRPEEIISPSLLIYPDRIEKNIQTMIRMVGDVQLLRPHIKTHKMREIIQMQLDHGIYKFKCATIAEAELLAKTGAKDILLAYQPAGIHISRFLALQEAYPASQFSTLVDNAFSLKEMQAMAAEKKTSISLWIDINNGMDRTGITPGPEAKMLYLAIVASEYSSAKGFHVYDGHLRNPKFKERKAACDHAFKTVLDFKSDLEASGLSVPAIVAGGSPTFGIHCEREGVEKSPGTTLLWDQGYGQLFPELDFLHAAVLLTRIISKPTTTYLCFDLGHKSIAPEMNFPRVKFLDLPESEQLKQSEEHLIVSSSTAAHHQVGDIHYALPMHICPTVAKYDQVLTVNERKVTGAWPVAARNYKIDI